MLLNHNGQLVDVLIPCLLTASFLLSFVAQALDKLEIALYLGKLFVTIDRPILDLFNAIVEIFI